VFLLFGTALVASGAAGLAWAVVYALSGNAALAERAALWGGGVFAELFLLGVFAVFVLDERDREGGAARPLIVAPFTGLVLAVVVCIHYCVVTGSEISGLALVRTGLAAAVTFPVIMWVCCNVGTGKRANRLGGKGAGSKCRCTRAT